MYLVLTVGGRTDPERERGRVLLWNFFCYLVGHHLYKNEWPCLYLLIVVLETAPVSVDEAF